MDEDPDISSRSGRLRSHAHFPYFRALPSNVGSAAAIGLLLGTFMLATVANIVHIDPLVFRVVFAIAALLALFDRTAAAILLVCIPALGIHWSNGQMSLPLAALTGEALRVLSRREYRRPRVTPLDGAIALFAMAAFLSVPTATVRRESFFVAVQLLLLVGTYMFLSRALTNERLRRTVSTCLVCTGTYIGLVGLIQVFLPGIPVGFRAIGGSGLSFAAARATGFFENPNTFGVMLVLCAVVALELAMTSPSPRRAFPWAGAVLVAVVGIELSYARAAYVGLAVGAITLIGIRAPRTRRRAVYVTAAIAILIASAAITRAADRGFSVATLAKDPSTMDRVYLGRASLRMFQDHPAAGVGAGGFALEYPGYRDERVTVSPVTDPHQSLVSIPAELGLLGLLAELGVVGALSWAFIRARGAVTARAVSVAGVAASVAFLSMSALNTQHYLYSFWVALALAGAFMLDEQLTTIGGASRP